MSGRRWYYKILLGYIIPGGFLISNYRKVISLINPIEDYYNQGWYLIEVLDDSFSNITTAKLIEKL